ncbi:MAG: PT domain-containing protein [Candidatus Odinarchaeia archaeon]
MAIRVEHGQVRDYAALGKLAGEATAAREQAARQAALDRQILSIQAQQAAQQRQYAQQKELREFDAFLNMEKLKRAEAFELHKMEQRSLHDFKMVEARREADFQNQMQREQRQQQELDAKLKALAEKAPVEMGGDGFLTAEQYQDAVMKVQTGYAIKRPTIEKPRTFRDIEADYDYYLDIVQQYQRDYPDVQKGLGKRKGTALLDKKGKFLREATPAEEAQLVYAETKLKELGERFREATTHDGVTGQVSTLTRQPIAEPIAQPVAQPIAQPVSRLTPQPTPQLLGQASPTDIKLLETALPKIKDKVSQTQLMEIILRADPVEVQEALKRLGVK